MLEGIAVVGLIAAILLPSDGATSSASRPGPGRKRRVSIDSEKWRGDHQLIAGAWRGNACAVLRHLGLEIEASR